jgi:predicted protein tyrosine phosphatase
MRGIDRSTTDAIACAFAFAAMTMPSMAASLMRAVRAQLPSERVPASSSSQAMMLLRSDPLLVHRLASRVDH